MKLRFAKQFIVLTQNRFYFHTSRVEEQPGVALLLREAELQDYRITTLSHLADHLWASEMISRKQQKSDLLEVKQVQLGLLPRFLQQQKQTLLN